MRSAYKPSRDSGKRAVWGFMRMPGLCGREGLWRRRRGRQPLLSLKGLEGWVRSRFPCRSVDTKRLPRLTPGKRTHWPSSLGSWWPLEAELPRASLPWRAGSLPDAACCVLAASAVCSEISCRPQYLWGPCGPAHSVLGGRCWVQQVPKSRPWASRGGAGACVLPAGMMLTAPAV